MKTEEYSKSGIIYIHIIHEINSPKHSQSECCANQPGPNQFSKYIQFEYFPLHYRIELILNYARTHRFTVQVVRLRSYVFLLSYCELLT